MFLYAQRSVLRVWHSPTLVTWASLVIRLGGLAILLPLILTRFDASEVLVWQLLSTIFLITGWLDFGFSPTFSRMIAFIRGGGTLAQLRITMLGKTKPAGQTSVFDPDALAPIFNTQRIIVTRLIVLAMGAAIPLGTLALRQPIADLADPMEGWGAWGMTIIASIFSLIQIANIAVLSGFDQIAFARRVETGISLLQLSTTSLAVLAGADLFLVVFLYCFWQIPLCVIGFFAARRYVKLPTTMAARKIDREVFNIAWPAAWRSGLGVLLSAGIIQVSGIWYAQITPPVQAVSYLLAVRFLTAISQIAQAPFYSRLPAMAYARGGSDDDAILKLVSRGMALSNWVLVAGALGVIFAAPPLLEWIGSSAAWPDWTTTTLLVLGLAAERYGGMHAQNYALTNRVIFHIANGVSAAIMVGAYLILSPFFAEMAIPAAIVVAYFGFFIWYSSWQSFKVLPVNRLVFDVKTAIAPLAILIVGIMLSALIY